jgi:hypothetical protein
MSGMMRKPLLTLAVALAAFAPASARAQANPDCALPRADRAVYGITLANPESAIRVLGRDVRTVTDNPASDNAWTIFASRDNKQLLELRHHAGDLEYSYMEFEVKYGRHDRKPMKLPVYEFVAGSGIKLGMKRKAVVARMGNCFKSTSKDGNEIIRYEIAETGEKRQNPLLKAANMPQYYSEYEFRNGTLIRFRFGHAPV